MIVAFIIAEAIRWAMDKKKLWTSAVVVAYPVMVNTQSVTDKSRIFITARTKTGLALSVSNYLALSGFTVPDLSNSYSPKNMLALGNVNLLWNAAFAILRHMYHIRITKTASNARAIQVVRYDNRKLLIVAHIGSTHNDKDLTVLKRTAQKWIEKVSRQRPLFSETNRKTPGLIPFDKCRYLGIRGLISNYCT